MKTEIKPLEEALNEGVIALFEDKYEEQVRVVKFLASVKNSAVEPIVVALVKLEVSIYSLRVLLPLVLEE